MKKRFKLIPAAYLFLVRDGDVLLQRRANTGYEDGNWGVPSGHLNGDESATMALVRETEEEIGLSINAQYLTFVHLMHRRGTEGGMGVENERVDLFFVLTQSSGEPRINEPHHCDALDWFPLTALPENTIAYVREALEAYQHGRAYSQRGW
jgi:ADP-ribose pyrophosphatase YjhB (NUDIX family)